MGISSALKRVLSTAAKRPALTAHGVSNLDSIVGAHEFADTWTTSTTTTEAPERSNPLSEWFDAHHVGRGILKWRHYFSLYHCHFQRFIGREVHMVEIGIYSGGSLDMWKAYFGPRLRLYGVDIAPACQCYEDERTKVFIGDQADRTFWKSFRTQVPRVDIVLDDGGHQHQQQIVTLEELLPHLQPGGVYACEDIHSVDNAFAAYVGALSTRLHALGHPTPFQRDVKAVHLYPYMALIERRSGIPKPFAVDRHGTEWEPFSVMKDGR